MHKSLQLSEVTQLPYRKSNGKVLNFGMTDSTYWMRAQVYFQEDCDKFMEFESQNVDTLTLTENHNFQ